MCCDCDRMNGVRKPNFFLSLFFKQGWAVIWQRVKVLSTSQISPFLPAILPSAWRDQFQLFLQVNTPVCCHNATGREGHLLSMGANCARVLHDWNWEDLSASACDSCSCHSNISSNPLTGWSSYCVRLRAVIQRQTSWRTQHQRKHEQPILMSTHAPLMTEWRSVIIRQPLTFTSQRSTGSLSKRCCLSQVHSSSYRKLKDKSVSGVSMIRQGTVWWNRHSDSSRRKCEALLRGSALLFQLLTQNIYMKLMKNGLLC